jgi:hypothetical protein
MENCYIIKLREFIKTNEEVYKIGRTSVGKKRLRGYPKNSEIILMKETADNENTERLIMEKFKNKFKQRIDIGREYFEGDIDKMKELFLEIIKFVNCLNILDIKYDDVINNRDIKNKLKDKNKKLEEIKKEIKIKKQKLKDVNKKIKSLNKKIEKVEKVVKENVNEESLNNYLDKWFEEKYKKCEKKSIISIKDIYTEFKETDYYVNLSKYDKTKYKKSYFVNYFEKNDKLRKYYNMRYNNMRNVICSFERI